MIEIWGLESRLAALRPAPSPLQDTAAARTLPSSGQQGLVPFLREGARVGGMDGLSSNQGVSPFKTPNFSSSCPRMRTTTLCQALERGGGPRGASEQPYSGLNLRLAI